MYINIYIIQTILFFVMLIFLKKTPATEKAKKNFDDTVAENETKDAIIIVSLFLASFTVSYKLQKGVL